MIKIKKDFETALREFRRSKFARLHDPKLVKAFVKAARQVDGVDEDGLLYFINENDGE